MDTLAVVSSNAADFADSEMEALARETDMPVEIVHEVYRREREKIERNARIKAYVPVLTHRHVRELLRERRMARS